MDFEPATSGRVDNRACGNVILITTIANILLILLSQKPFWSIPVNSLWAMYQGSDNRGVITTGG